MIWLKKTILYAAAITLPGLLYTGCGPHIERRVLSLSDTSKITSANFRSAAFLPDGTAKVQTSGRLRCYDAANKPSDVCIVAVGTVLSIPDEHGSEQYKIVDINRAGVKISFQSHFDHRSFGKNLISETSADLILPWSNESSTAITGGSSGANAGTASENTPIK